MPELFEALRKDLDHIVAEFQLGDIERTLGPAARANFLAAQGLVVCTEFLGGIRNGTLGHEKPGLARARFVSGLQLLGKGYESNAAEAWLLRCGLLHSYLPKGRPGRDYVITNSPGLEVGFQVASEPQTGREQVVVNVARWLTDLKAAYAGYWTNCESTNKCGVKQHSRFAWPSDPARTGAVKPLVLCYCGKVMSVLKFALNEVLSGYRHRLGQGQAGSH